MPGWSGWLVLRMFRGMFFSRTGGDRSLVEHLRSDIAELPQLGVGDALDGAGVLHDLGVGHEEAGDVSPVFVDVGVSAAAARAPVISAAAAGEGLDAAVGHGPRSRGDHPAARGGAAQGLVAGG